MFDKNDPLLVDSGIPGYRLKHVPSSECGLPGGIDILERIAPEDRAAAEKDRLARADSLVTAIESLARAIESNPQPAAPPPAAGLIATIEDSRGGVNKPNAKQAKPVALSKIRDRKRYQVIFGAIDGGYKSHEYCSFLKDRKLQLPSTWDRSKRYRDYAEAYRTDAGLRQKITNEKSKYERQYKLMSEQDRERVINGNFD